MNKIRFPDKRLVLYFHYHLIRDYGGSYNLRDENLPDSALAQPEATFDGKYLHKDIFKMAAAYGFHLCRNHPFVDGNKRISLAVMDTFLRMNNFQITADEKKVYLMMLDLSQGKLDKKGLSEWLRKNCSILK